MDKIFKTATSSERLMLCLFAVILIAFIAFVIYSSIPEETATARRYVRRNKKKISFTVKQYQGSIVTRCDVSIGRYSKSYWLNADYSKLSEKRRKRIKNNLIADFSKTVVDVIETAETAKWLEGAK